MKGIVFTEYLEFIEDTFGLEIAQRMIDNAALINDGVYTSVGTYNSSELVTMVDELSQLTNIEIPVLLKTYGEHLFSRFAIMYPHFFPKELTINDFFYQIDTYIHVEVKKLYPDAELPLVEVISNKNGVMEIMYSSSRKFGDFAFGLLSGAITHFKQNIEITKSLVEQDGSKVKFILKNKDH